jgi:ribosomal protein S18 acetylase RimI-like enzyme
LGERLLKIRRFILGRDEADWVELENAISRVRPDYGPWATVEEFRAYEKWPEFDSEGRFIAELDGNPVGIVHAHVDKLREEKRGFIDWFGVIPEHRSRGIEEKLAETAIKELKNRGMKVVQSYVHGEPEGDIRMWKNMGFKLIRTGSLMTKELAELPNVGGNMEVELKPLRREADEDLEKLNALHNECFKEHFLWRPKPLRTTVYLVRELSNERNPFMATQGWWFALLGGKHVGFVGASIDEHLNTAKGAKYGWIFSIGVLKPHRKTGIGTRLILHGMNFLKDNGMTTAMLGVDDWNVTKARQLYEKVGFKVVWKESSYEKNTTRYSHAPHLSVFR